MTGPGFGGLPSADWEDPALIRGLILSALLKLKVGTAGHGGEQPGFAWSVGHIERAAQNKFGILFELNEARVQRAALRAVSHAKFHKESHKPCIKAHVFIKQDQKAEIQRKIDAANRQQPVRQGLGAIRDRVP